MLCVSRFGVAQDTPLLSGGVGFLSNTNAGNTTYTPIIEPLLAAPIGRHFLFESRATLLEAFSPGPNGYIHTHFTGLNYFQGDYIASRHFTIVGGSFLIPFNSYNERLSPLWIGNFQDVPLATNLGLMGTGTGVGGMVRGSAISRPKYSIDYATYFSARSGNEQFNSERSAGGRASLYLPEQRLEVGLSYNRLLQGTHENFYGSHVWWEPKDTAFRLRSEYARGHHAQGYWIEADYRTQAFGGLESFIGRFEPLFRMQQTFRRDTIVSDGVPLVNTQQADFGLDYNLPHSVRILTSYSRQFSSAGNANKWETGIVYRFLFPAWKGK
ncbi:hypothetical protein ACPOL_1923 [Acidisarcina polymorpha]|uniref:Uncharacterized protein n=2 Tax=Acidisarcina polymorpha TaxID=2211140 RepID=A0A2Z5FWK4_9BACT|nr:hypothetical protein ACPOL_1923 [Acidisarcina polymorpha]